MDTEPIRVLFVNDHLGAPEGTMHGVTRYFLNVLPYLDRCRVNPTLCILRPRHAVAERFEDIGVQPVFLGRRKWDPRSLSDLVRLVRDRDIEVLHVAGMKGCLLGRVAAVLTKRRAIIHLHDTINPGRILRFLQRRVARWTDVALAVSDPVGALAIEHFGVPGDRVVTLHNGLDVSAFSKPSAGARARVRAELGIASAARVIGLIGRIVPEKGHEVILRAWPSLMARCPDVVLLVAGNGPGRRECERLVERLKLQEAVRFAGYRTDISDVLGAVDVVVMPSVKEGFPFTALEATAAGKPVVAFRVGGLPEIVIDGETGLLVPPGDGNGLVDALLQVLTDADVAARLSDACLRHAQRFTIERHVQRLDAIYRSVARSSPTRERTPRHNTPAR